jgi:hypothetical protein
VSGRVHCNSLCPPSTETGERREAAAPSPGVGLEVGFVGGVSLDILRAVQGVPPGFWDGFVTISSLDSRIAVALPIFSTFAICRQLSPWSLSWCTALLLNVHFGRPLCFAGRLPFETTI